MENKDLKKEKMNLVWYFILSSAFVVASQFVSGCWGDSKYGGSINDLGHRCMRQFFQTASTSTKIIYYLLLIGAFVTLIILIKKGKVFLARPDVKAYEARQKIESINNKPKMVKWMFLGLLIGALFLVYLYFYF